MVARGVTINGLMLHAGGPRGTGYGGLATGLLDIDYEDCVIGGPGAFFLSVQAPEQLADAIRRKLVMEIAGRPPTLMPARLAQRPPRTDERSSPRIDRLIGEKTRPAWLDENR